MFEVKSIKFDNLDALQLFNANTGEQVSVLPQFGANIFEMKLKQRNKLYSIIKGFENAEKLKINYGFYNAHLFPFAGRLPDGKYAFGGQDYQFEINDAEFHAALHGFLYNQPMRLIEKIADENHAEVTFSFVSEKVNAAYPFNIEVIIRYQLNEKGFTSMTTFKNHGETEAPLAYGVHPYFRFDKKVDELHIKIPTETETILNKRLVPSGETKINSAFLDATKIGHRGFDNGFQFPKISSTVTTELSDPEENCTINIWQETGKNKFNFLQVYTPPQRDCIAIEPLCGNINSLNTDDDRVVLKPGEKTELSWGVRLI